MDLILINEEKLKIILSQSDMERLNIDVESLDYSNVTTKKVFWELLDEAKVKAGFNADKSKLYVQVFPSRDGGCEMFVTKFSNSARENSGKKKIFRMSPAKAIEQEDGQYVVLGFDELCKLCRRISKEKLLFSTSLYYNLSGEYILTVEQGRKTPSYISAKNTIIQKIPYYFSEYGRTGILTEGFLAYTNEHCKKIASENAVELLSSV